MKIDPYLMSEEQLKAEGADVVAIANAAGFVITTEDLNSHRQNLSDDELEGVAGGLMCFSSNMRVICAQSIADGIDNTLAHDYAGVGGCWTTCYTLKAPANKGAIYFFNPLNIRLKRHPIPGTLNLQTTTNL